MLLTKREKREKQEKEEDNEPNERNATNVELYSGEEGVSSRSPSGSPSVLSRTSCPYAGVQSESEAPSASGKAVLAHDKKAAKGRCRMFSPPHDNSDRRTVASKESRSRPRRSRIQEMRGMYRQRSGRRRTSWRWRNRDGKKTIAATSRLRRLVVVSGRRFIGIGRIRKPTAGRPLIARDELALHWKRLVTGK